MTKDAYADFAERYDWMKQEDPTRTEFFRRLFSRHRVRTLLDCACGTGRDLILATPTVDIGYNFKKLGKARQNVDWIVCDARYGDELIQRLLAKGLQLVHPLRHAGEVLDIFNARQDLPKDLRQDLVDGPF